MDEWVADIAVWPFFGCDQKEVGDAMQKFTVSASDITEALEKIKLIVAGITTNPRVWQAPILSIKKKG